MLKPAALLIALTVPAAAGTIEPGLYWDPAQPGSGYSIETQGGRITVVVFKDGQPWTFATGPYVDASLPSASLPMKRGEAKSGGLSVAFSGPRDALVSLDGEAPVAVTRFSFTDAANPLLGSWGCSYSIGAMPTVKNTFGCRVTFATVGVPVNEGGTGMVRGYPGTYAGECYASGPLAGRCLIVQTSSASFVEAWDIEAPVNEWRGCYRVMTGSRTCYPVAGLRTGSAAQAVAAAPAPMTAAGSRDEADPLAEAKLSADRTGAPRATSTQATTPLAKEIAALASAIGTAPR